MQQQTKSSMSISEYSNDKTFMSVFEKRIENSLCAENVGDVIFQVPFGKYSDNKLGMALFYSMSGLFALQSEVFNRMLYGQMMESHSNHIKIDDIDPSTFKYLKLYMYGVYPTLTHNNIIGVLYASDKYLLKQLKLVCIDTIVKQYISSKNINSLQTKNDDSKNILLQLFIGLYKIGLIDIIESHIIPVLYKELSNRNYYEILDFIQCDDFIQLPFRLFELLLFDNKLSIVLVFKDKFTKNDIKQICVKWTTNTLKTQDSAQDEYFLERMQEIHEIKNVSITYDNVMKLFERRLFNCQINDDSDNSSNGFLGKMFGYVSNGIKNTYDYYKNEYNKRYNTIDINYNESLKNYPKLMDEYKNNMEKSFNNKSDCHNINNFTLLIEKHNPNASSKTNENENDTKMDSSFVGGIDDDDDEMNGKYEKIGFMRCLLDIHCPFFKSLKVNDNNNNTYCIEDNKITINSIYFLREYVYGMYPTITLNNVIEVLYLSQKYMINDLYDVCIVALRNKFCEYIDVSIMETLLIVLPKLIEFGMLDEIYKNQLLPSIRNKLTQFENNNQSFTKSMLLGSAVLAQTPLKLFDLLLFNNDYCIFNTNDIEPSILWQCCLHWSKYHIYMFKTSNDVNNNNGNKTDNNTSSIYTINNVNIHSQISTKNVKDESLVQGLYKIYGIKAQNPNLVIDLPLLMSLFKEKINFKAMNAKYFQTHVKQIVNGFLTKDEIIDIISNHSNTLYNRNEQLENRIDQLNRQITNLEYEKNELTEQNNALNEKNRKLVKENKQLKLLTNTHESN